jgi:hypothetical protein
VLDPFRHRGVGPAEQERAPVGFGAEHHCTAAGDAGHLPDDPPRFGDVLEGAVDPQRIEAAIRERKVRPVGHDEFTAAAGVSRLRRSDECAAAVSAHGTDASRLHPHHIVTESAGYIEGAATRLKPKEIDGARLIGPPRCHRLKTVETADDLVGRGCIDIAEADGQGVRGSVRHGDLSGLLLQALGESVARSMATVPGIVRNLMVSTRGL